MIAGTCHCGTIRIEVPARPQALIDCNCSICRRNGALWARYDRDSVVISGHPEHTTEYVWGPKTIKTMRCNTCGSVTHWESVEPQPKMQIGVNMRNFEPRELDKVRVRRFDGADTWSFLDE